MKSRQVWSQVKAVMGIMHGSRSFSGPVQANLNIINRCNLRCVHCFYNSPFLDKPALRMVRRARRDKGELPQNGEIQRVLNLVADPERIKTLIDEIVALGTRRFQFSGMGEVFLNEHVLEFMERAKKAGCNCVANTNGTLLDRDTIDELIRMRFDRLRVSTMAGTREIYSLTHPGVDETMFDRLKEQLLYLSERKKELGVNRPKIVVCSTVISQNRKEIFEFAKFARTVRANRVQYHPFDVVEDSGLAQLAISTEEASSVRQQLIDAKAFLEANGIDHNIGNFLKVSYDRLDTTAFYRVIPCYYGWLAVRVGVDGDVYSCCRCFEPMGNIYRNTFQAIWNGDAYRRFRKEAKTIHKRGTSVRGCDCSSCVHHHANLRVYRFLHPLKGRSSRVKSISPKESVERDACET